jgi:uncharacterized protein
MTHAHRLRYADLSGALARLSVPTDASEAHGSLWGMLCAGSDEGAGWIEDTLEGVEPGDALAQESRALLGALREESLRQAASPGFEFQPLLPEDSEPLAQRAEALGSWCRGFLYGFGRSVPSHADTAPEAVREILGDLVEISRVAFEVGEGTEEDEAAYTELVEYLRVAVLTIREELGPEQKPPLH